MCVGAKGEVVLVRTMKARGGRRRIVSRILKPVTRWLWMVSFMSQPF